jgi:hypothetical protein
MFWEIFQHKALLNRNGTAYGSLAFAGTTNNSRRGALGGELRRLMLCRQRIDQFAQRFA